MNIKSTASVGSTPQMCFVAMLDILGFKNLVRSTNIANVYQQVRNLQNAANLSANVSVVGMGGVTYNVTPWVLGSDTILAWCNDNPRDLDSFLITCGDLVANGIQIGMPLRGAISYGECIIDPLNSIYIGEALGEAHILEGCQQWAGIGVSDSCFRSSACKKYLETTDELVVFDVPLKRKYLRKPPFRVSRAVNWPVRRYDPQCDIDLLIEKAPKKGKGKLKNTKNFVVAMGK